MAFGRGQVQRLFDRTHRLVARQLSCCSQNTAQRARAVVVRKSCILSYLYR